MAEQVAVGLVRGEEVLAEAVELRRLPALSVNDGVSAESSGQSVVERRAGVRARSVTLMHSETGSTASASAAVESCPWPSSLKRVGPGWSVRATIGVVRDRRGVRRPRAGRGELEMDERVGRDLDAEMRADGVIADTGLHRGIAATRREQQAHRAHDPPSVQRPDDR